MCWRSLENARWAVSGQWCSIIRDIWIWNVSRWIIWSSESRKRHLIKKWKNLAQEFILIRHCPADRWDRQRNILNSFFQNITVNMILFISMHPILLFYACRLLQSMESVIELYIAMQLYMRRVKEKRCGIECFGAYLKSTLPIGSDARRQQERSFLAKKIILC